MVSVRLIERFLTLHSSQTGLSDVPRVFSSLPPLDSLVCVGAQGEEPGQHMTLRFRVKPAHHDAAETHTHKWNPHMEIPDQRDKTEQLGGQNWAFQTRRTNRKKAQMRLKMEEPLFTDVLRHPPLCSSPLLSSRQVSWQRPTSSWQLKALHICRLVW